MVSKRVLKTNPHLRYNACELSLSKEQGHISGSSTIALLTRDPMDETGTKNLALQQGEEKERKTV